MRTLFLITDWAGDSLRTTAFDIALRGFLDANDTSIHTQIIATTQSHAHAQYVIEHVTHLVSRWGNPEETVVAFCPSYEWQVRSFAEDPAGLAVARSVQGLLWCGWHIAPVLARVAPQIERIWQYKIEHSVESNPVISTARVAAHLACYAEERLDMQELHVSVVPAVSGDQAMVGHIEGNARWYLTMRWSQLAHHYPAGSYVHIHAGGKSVSVHVGGDPSRLSAEVYALPSDWGPADDPYVMLFAPRADGALSLRMLDCGAILTWQ